MNAGLPATPRHALPWYVHPAEDPTAWARLAATTPVPSFVVVNVHDGPGVVGDPYYPDAIATLHRHRVLGYVPMAWGARPQHEVLADVRAWVSRYRVAGVMLDEFPSGGPEAAWLPVVRGARAHGAGFVVGNPGVVPGRAQLEALDVTCVFEGTAAEHERTSRSAALADLPPDRLWHLVHDCPPDRIAAALDQIGGQGVGHAFVTDRRLPHPWGGLPLAQTAGAR